MQSRMNFTDSNGNVSESLGLFDENCRESIASLGVNTLPRGVVIAFGCIALALAVPMVILNFLVVMAIARRKKLQKTSNVFLCGIAANDFITGLVLLPSLATIYLSPDPIEICTVINVTTVFAFGTILGTFCGMLLLVTDRYLAIFRPFFYHKLTDTKSRIVKFMLAVLVVCFCLSIGSFFTPRKALFIYPAMLLLVVTLVWSTYVHTRSYLLSRRIRASDKQMTRNSRDLKTEERKRRIGVMVAVMLATLCCCFFPYLGGIALDRIDRGSTVTMYFYPITVLLLMANSLFNPLIYCWKLREIRREITKIVVPNYSVDLSSGTVVGGTNNEEMPSKL